MDTGMSIRSLNWPLLVLFFFMISQSTSKLNLPPPLGKYKVGMLLPFASQSHRNCFIPLAKSLADRGHEVVVLSGLPPKINHPKVKEINHGVEVLSENLDMFHVRDTDPTGGFAMFKVYLPKLAREIYDNPEVKEFYDHRKEVDLFIIDELFNEPAYPFVVGVNWAAIATAGIVPASSATLGNVLNPSYFPAITSDYPRPYSFVQRIKNLFGHIFLAVIWRHIDIFPVLQEELSGKFPDFPPLAEIEKNRSLILANTHFSLDFPAPILPSQVEVGGMHCHPGKKLPQDLQSFIDGAGSDGVIYFSLGSVCTSKSIPQKYKTILLEAFSKLKQRVIWKFEEEFKGLPKNIMIQKWLPQQDILANPKVKLFITHGGLLSMQESLYHSKPLLALPVFGDQERNGQRIQNNDFGKFLLWENLTVDNLLSTIKTLIEDPKYKRKVEDVSKSFRDQQTQPLERAVWWIEYVIRHNGAPQLKSPAADLSWIEYLMIDVIITIHIIIFTIYWVMRKLFQALCSLCRKSSPSKGKKNKKE